MSLGPSLRVATLVLLSSFHPLSASLTAGMDAVGLCQLVTDTRRLFVISTAQGDPSHINTHLTDFYVNSRLSAHLCMVALFVAVQFHRVPACRRRPLWRAPRMLGLRNGHV
jgi:hypothetical protein